MSFFALTRVVLAFSAPHILFLCVKLLNDYVSYNAFHPHTDLNPGSHLNSFCWLIV